MTERSITVYPGDTFTVYVSEGQSREAAQGDGDQPSPDAAPADLPESAGAVVETPDPASVGPDPEPEGEPEADAGEDAGDQPAG